MKPFYAFSGKRPTGSPGFMNRDRPRVFMTHRRRMHLPQGMRDTIVVATAWLKKRSRLPPDPIRNDAMATSDQPDTAGPAGSFAIKDCALVALATGRKARLLQAFRRELADIDAASIYHHFWGGLLQPRFEEREYNNDFAAWVRHGIHDAVLAERLSALVPTSFPDLEALRQEIIELIDIRMDEVEYLSWARATLQFEFVCSQIVVFNTDCQLRHPSELAAATRELSMSSIFYHFIDARRRTRDGRDDFSDWLAAFGDEFAPLQEQLACIDPYFGDLGELRDTLAALFSQHVPEAAQ
jgi:hypothetical protein